MTLSCIMVTAMAFVSGNDLDTVLEQANAAADAGDLDNAIASYQSIVDAEPSASGAWFNLGNAALQSDQIGRAIAAYRTAAALAPRDAAVANNLTLARKSVNDSTPLSEPNALTRLILFWHYQLSLAELGWIALLASVLCWGAALALNRFPSLGTVAKILGCIVLVTVFASWAIRTAFPTTIAVVSRDEAPVRTHTDRRADVRFTADEGAELRWHDVSGVWIRVARADGAQGWIHRDDVHLLSL
ncbi:MAG: tetratricopeptide repeat protein [Myxococcota bacterium]